MKKRAFSYIISLLLAITLLPVSASAFSNPFSRQLGDYSLMELVPNELSPGFPVYAARTGLQATSGFTKQEVLATPIGRSIQQTTLEVINGKNSDYDKVKAIHNWVHSNIQYDYDRIRRANSADNNSSALKTFDEKKGVCEGYNYLTALMLYFAGIPTVDYGGISRPNADATGAHAWIAAFVDGSWIYFDPTWDKFDMPYNFHQNVEIFRFSNGYYTFEWLAYNNVVGIRVQGFIPEDVTEITLPGNYDSTNVHVVDVSDNNVIKAVVPATFPLSEIDSFFSSLPKLEEVELEYGITSIPSEAFTHYKNLKKIVIPDSVTSIDISAFDSILDLTIYCIAGSYAETYAIENDIPFIAAAFEPPAPMPTPLSSVPVVVEAPAPLSITVTPTASTVLVNGVITTFEAYNIGGNNFFKLRDIAAAINGTAKQFDLGYDSVTATVTLASGMAYTPAGGELTQGDAAAKTAIPTLSTIYLDGEQLNFIVYNIGGNNFFKLRNLMSALNIAVTYDEVTRNIGIDTSSEYVE